MDMNENDGGGGILDKAEQSILQKQRAVARCDDDSDKVRHCSQGSFVAIEERGRFC